MPEDPEAQPTPEELSLKVTKVSSVTSVIVRSSNDTIVAISVTTPPPPPPSCTKPKKVAHILQQVTAKYEKLIAEEVQDRLRDVDAELDAAGIISESEIVVAHSLQLDIEQRR